MQLQLPDRNKISGEKSDDSVQDAVQKVAKALLIDAVFQAESEIYYIYTTHRVAAMLTKNFEVEYLDSALKDDYGISTAIGYGIGNSITEAKKHAENALRESWSSTGSFVMQSQTRFTDRLVLPSFRVSSRIFQTISFRLPRNASYLHLQSRS